MLLEETTITVKKIVPYLDWDSRNSTNQYRTKSTHYSYDEDEMVGIGLVQSRFEVTNV